MGNKPKKSPMNRNSRSFLWEAGTSAGFLIYWYIYSDGYRAGLVFVCIT